MFSADVSASAMHHQSAEQNHSSKIPKNSLKTRHSSETCETQKSKLHLEKSEKLGAD
jgi:hypothetical protein